MSEGPIRPTPLAGLLPEEITDGLSLEPAYRGRQIFRNIWSGVDDFAGMTDLPAPMREHLAAAGPLITSRVERRFVDGDGSVKVRVRLEDGAALESVILKDDRGRLTLCLSTQVGCAMGCRFCATAAMGFQRNAAAHEITEQVLLASRETDGISNIVFMGMGEPLLNLDNLRRSVAVLTHPLGLSLSPRRLTVSTCGITDGVRSLTEDGPPVRLAVSLQTADPQLRGRLMPGAAAHPLDVLKDALLLYQRKTGFRITLEVVLLEGINDRVQDVEEIARFASGLRIVVNLIPWNPVAGLRFRSPAPSRIHAFRRRLESHRLAVTQRYRRGRGVRAACGQLFVPGDALQDSPDPPDSG